MAPEGALEGVDESLVQYTILSLNSEADEKEFQVACRAGGGGL